MGEHKPWCDRHTRGKTFYEGGPDHCVCDRPDPRTTQRRDGKDRRAWGSPGGSHSKKWVWRNKHNRRRIRDRRKGGDDV